MWSTWNALGVRAGGEAILCQEFRGDRTLHPGGAQRLDAARGGQEADRFGYCATDKDVAESAASRRKAEGEYSEYFL